MTASVLLVIGYPLALGALARLRPVLAERRLWWFAALEAGTASIMAGWFLHRRPLAAAVNGAIRLLTISLRIITPDVCPAPAGPGALHPDTTLSGSGAAAGARKRAGGGGPASMTAEDRKLIVGVASSAGPTLTQT